MYTLGSLIEVIKIQEGNQPTARRGFSLGSVLLIVLLVAAGVGVLAYTVGNALGRVAVSNPISQLLQTSVTNSSNSATSHNCPNGT